MLLTFLGTGTSTGVPFIGCKCAVCSSNDPRDNRLRSSALLTTDDGANILIDCGPDFRQQMMAREFRKIDGVLLTHNHYDHVGGLDDLRPFCVFGDVPLWGEESCLNAIFEHLKYCFAEHRYPGAPRFTLNPVRPHEDFRIGDQSITPLRVMHGHLPILGYRIGRLAYITDMKTIPDEEPAYLEGIETLVINGLRFKAHNSHQTIPEAVAFARRIGAKQTYLTHLCHSAGLHAETTEMLPPNIHLAYDGLSIHC